MPVVLYKEYLSPSQTATTLTGGHNQPGETHTLNMYSNWTTFKMHDVHSMHTYIRITTADAQEQNLSKVTHRSLM